MNPEKKKTMTRKKKNSPAGLPNNNQENMPQTLSHSELIAIAKEFGSPVYVYHAEKIKEQYTLGLNKYIKGHRIKLQSDVTYEQDRLDEVNATVKDFWIYRFQIEVGI